MLTDFNEICMSATPGHDKTLTWFLGNFTLFLQLLQKLCFMDFLASPLRVIVPSKYYFTAMIISFSDEKLRHSYFCSKYRLWVRLNESPLTHKIYALEQNKNIIVNPFQPNLEFQY